MTMKWWSVVLVLTAITILGQAMADEGHGKKNFSFGAPGNETDVSRTIEVTATDDMKFSPPTVTIQQGETIRFVVHNAGNGVHEFSVGDAPSQRAHAALMKRNPNMKHEGDPTAVTVEPGATKTLVWRFDKKMTQPLVFACQIPRHYDAGMVIRATLAAR